jgi:hypothetical protein
MGEVLELLSRGWSIQRRVCYWRLIWIQVMKKIPVFSFLDSKGAAR